MTVGVLGWHNGNLQVDTHISEHHLWSARKWDTRAVMLQRHVARKLATQIHWRREDKMSQSSANMIKTCGNPDTKLPDQGQHPTQGTHRSEKWQDSLCYGQRWEMGTKMLSTSSHLSLISLATFLATCVGNLTPSPHSQHRIHQYDLRLIIYNPTATNKFLLNPPIRQHF